MGPAVRPAILVTLLLLCAGSRDAVAQATRPAAEAGTIYASTLGFDAIDATHALQSAINSGARKVIVENMGTPWIVDKIQLASDQEIVLQKGVVIQAKRGAFKGTGDSLFSAMSRKNLTLTGNGATLKMWKEDYHAPAYQPAEWRHALNIRSCENVMISGLTLAGSGGDGIYLGVDKPGTTNTNVHIKDCVAVDNNRQGISVISARGLLIEDTILKDTGGTAPQAGIDFEPNSPSEMLSNIVLRNCVAENNRGGGFLFAMGALNGRSSDISIRLENCRARGRVRAVLLITANSEPPVKGLIEFVDCTFEASDDAGIAIRQKPAAGCKVRFERCMVTNSATKSSDLAPIAIFSGPGDRQDVGGVEFIDCTVADPLKRLPLSYEDWTGIRLTGITGKIAVDHAGQRTAYALDQQQIDGWFPGRVYRAIKDFDASHARYVPLAPSATPSPQWKSAFRQRGQASYRVFASAGDRVTLTALVQPVGQGAATGPTLHLTSPTGEKKPLGGVTVGAEATLSYVADTTGDYQIDCDAGANTIQMSSTTHRVNQYAQHAVFHYLSSAGEVYFYVPPGVAEFGVFVFGANAAERVKAALVDPAGKVVDEQDNITQAKQFVGTRTDTSRGQVWSLRLSKPSSGSFEDYYVRLQGIAPLMAASPQALLRPGD